ncbi:hypothetical protein Cni_G22622 [Canna indica]|uniref:Clp R domain-containing protein n=1 Tax=Canna indica TaxID=4628 RepID=A0AAQ3KRK5_9LILI|nr:hypothetical protein Cni_G22622 [Canna indica]
MRTGACTLQQALTVEATSVLKHSLGLARRRGHAQVTPLHVAATLLGSTSTASNLLRRACLKSQPHHPASHPLRCRALELCFNVALNRLPTTPPPSSAPLLGSQPSLSNALIAALKRAQAHQRRGCIELQQQQPPLLAIKVELEQLIISILDDPSVSRVMREAGFSSTCVKSNLEEESSSFLGQSSPFLLDSHRDFVSHGSSIWQSPLLKLSSPRSAPFPAQSSQEEDLNAVLDVMLRKQGRNNAVVVGDSVSVNEGIVDELMAKVERGEVAAGELKAAHFIKLHLSYIHLRLMSRSDVDIKLSDLRRKINSLASDRADRGVIIYAGDLRWAVDQETRDGRRFNPVEHMVAELGRLLSELGSTVSNKVWLMATASYQTYVRCQMRQPSLETQWALQAVVVPSGGLALSLQAPAPAPPSLTKILEYPLGLLGSKDFSRKEEENLVCCAECTSNFEKEASVFRSGIKDNNSGPSKLPCWLQKHSQDQQKDALQELKKKWHRQCQNLHQISHSQAHLHPHLFNQKQSSIGKSSSFSSSYPWWPCSNESKNLLQAHSLSFSQTAGKLDRGFPFKLGNGVGDMQERDEAKVELSEVNLHCLKSPGDQLDGRITLSLGSAMFSDSASSEQKEAMKDAQQLAQKLQQNIPRRIESSSDEELSLTDTIFIMTTSNSAACEDIGNLNNATKIKLQGEEPPANKDLKRNPDEETLVQRSQKRAKTGDCNLDLNILAEEEGDKAEPSDLTNEADGQSPHHLPPELLKLVAAEFTLDTDPAERSAIAVESLISSGGAPAEEQAADG